MEITEERYEDIGEKDPDGSYDYYYSGIMYTIRDGSHYFKARTSDYEPELVSILQFKIDGKEIAGEDLIAMASQNNGEHREPIVRVLEALHAKGYAKIDVLSSCGYEPLTLETS